MYAITPARRKHPAAPALVFAAALLAAAVASAAPALVLTVDRDNTSRGSGADRVRLVQIEIDVRSASTNTVSAELEWYFVASPIGGFGYYIADKGRQPLKIPPRQVVNVTKAATRIKEKEIRLKGGKTAKQQVAEVAGYIVRVTAGGKVVAMTGAPEFLRRKAADPAQFKQLLSNPGP